MSTALSSLKLSHFGDKAITEIEARDPHGPFRAKPRGFWISVDDEDDWESWCLAEDFRKEQLAIRHRVTLAPDANILLLSVGELLESASSLRPSIDVGAHAPGIYFGMPEEEYHADRSMSASGVKDIHVTPLTFWMKSGFNPSKSNESSEPQERGKAFHTRLLEGMEAFNERYAVAPEIEDYPEAIDGGEALKERCRELGLKVGGKIADLCARIREADPDAVLWPEIVETARLFAEKHGRIIIKRKLADEIQRQVRIIEMHPGTEKALRGGYCEVSIFWIDAETGVPMKSRIDYLKARAAVEMKTFTNPFGKPIDAAIAGNVANNKYFVDAIVRLNAIEHAKMMLRKNGMAIVHGEPPSAEWLNAFAADGPHTFVFLFLEAGDVPNVRVREFKQREREGAKDQNLYWMKGHAMYRQGVELYRQMFDHYGADLPWIDPQPLRPFYDSDFAVWALE